jgi:hypothetical protein
MDQILGCFLVLLFIITITVAMVSPCGGSAMVVALIITFLALLISNPEYVGEALHVGGPKSSITERIVGSEKPLDIDRMKAKEKKKKERLESKELQRVTQWGDRKEVDINLENKLFKKEHKNLDNSSAIAQAFARDETKERPHLTGDELLAHKMAHVSVKNRNAIHNRVRFTSDNFRKFFQEELDEQEDRHWWENDVLEDAT